MPVNLPELPELHPVAGIRLGTAAAGIRKPNRRDLVVIECTSGTITAAVFTRNRFCAAPVMLAREHLAQAAPRALLINTGYANAGTGELGRQDALACCQGLAERFDCTPAEVLPFSTGVIGERIPVERILAGLPVCISNLQETGWTDAAHGIMTTDTQPKGVSQRVTLGSHTLTVTGIAKGAGMIRPNMATMLAFVATDARATREVLQHCVSAAAEQSFNRITVDGDTSTNDACVLLATGKTQAPAITTTDDAAYKVLKNAVTDIFTELAQAIVRDAEGATKFITVEVLQGSSEAECLEVAYTIAHSPLVKTAFFASDPNWGRILAAIGRADVSSLDVQAVSVHLNEVCVLKNGAVAPDYTEAKGSAVMREPEIRLQVELGMGPHMARIWTSDLSHEYVRINAEYRT